MITEQITFKQHESNKISFDNTIDTFNSSFDVLS